MGAMCERTTKPKYSNIVICTVLVLLLYVFIYLFVGTSFLPHPIPSSQSYETQILLNQPNINHTNESQRDSNPRIETAKKFDLIEHAIEQRTTPPPKCNDSTHNLLNINPMQNNWAPYLFRCHLDYMEKWRHIFVDEAFVTKKLFYQHLYKGGGTTIQHGLVKLVKESKLTDLIQYDKVLIHQGGDTAISFNRFFKFIDNATLSFTFVRDPINKFLSAFYEACKRRHTRSRETGIGLLRKWIHDILSTHGTTANFHEHYKDFHAQPNMNFLWRAKPFNFIGNLDHLSNDMIQILDPFIVDQELKNNSDLLMKHYFVHQRNRETGYGKTQNAKYNIDRTQLSDDDIKNLCNIYWMDYICLPFELPKQCDIKELILKHYNKHVHYDECY